MDLCQGIEFILEFLTELNSPQKEFIISKPDQSPKKSFFGYREIYFCVPANSNRNIFDIFILKKS